MIGNSTFHKRLKTSEAEISEIFNIKGKILNSTSKTWFVNDKFLRYLKGFQEINE